MFENHLLEKVNFINIHGHYIKRSLDITYAHVVEKHRFEALDLLLLVTAAQVDAARRWAQSVSSLLHLVLEHQDVWGDCSIVDSDGSFGLRLLLFLDLSCSGSLRGSRLVLNALKDGLNFFILAILEVLRVWWEWLLILILMELVALDHAKSLNEDQLIRVLDLVLAPMLHQV
jgi:hypothetical protein